MLIGWAAGMAVGTYAAFDLDFKGSVYKVFGINAYEALWGLALNLVIAVVLTAILRAAGAGDSADETVEDDYDERDPVAGAVRPLPATPEQERAADPAGAR
jgi:solute:Na+ symporter, SSS family